jgi:RHS repeat-associated protein
VQQTVSGVTTHYTNDINAGLTQVLADGTNRYVYGLDRISQVGGTDTEYFLGDALGSVRQLADAIGAVTLENTYNPYGVVVQSIGTVQTSYGYTGESQSDGLVYLRARYYSAYLNRFIQRDTIEPDPIAPADWNRFAYTRDNPVNWLDPSGKITQKENIDALVIAADLRNRFGVHIVEDWGYRIWPQFPYQLFPYDGIPWPNINCLWQVGNWRETRELEIVRKGVEMLAAKMGGEGKFRSAMGNRPVEVARVPSLLYPFAQNTGLAFPFLPGYFMVKGIMLPNGTFDAWPQDDWGIYTVIHELGHVWDVRSGLSLSIGMATYLGNSNGVDLLSACGDSGMPADPIMLFACAMKYWHYLDSNEPAPGNPNGPYAATSLAEDWAEAVAYTVYPEFGIKVKYRPIGPIRKTYVEVAMRAIR